MVMGFEVEARKAGTSSASSSSSSSLSSLDCASQESATGFFFCTAVEEGLGDLVEMVRLLRAEGRS